MWLEMSSAKLLSVDGFHYSVMVTTSNSNGGKSHDQHLRCQLSTHKNRVVDHD